MDAITSISGRLAPLPFDDVDTDQIIPARFLKVTDRTGLGRGLFRDWRRDADGKLKSDFPLNRPGHEEATILVTGRNFGCGSSREHAPWALLAAGFRAIVSPEFADIFGNNALKNGLLTATVERAVQRELLDIAAGRPKATVTLDLRSLLIMLPGKRTAPFTVDGFARRCLLEGVDELGYLLGKQEEVAAYERARPAKIAVGRR